MGEILQEDIVKVTQQEQMGLEDEFESLLALINCQEVRTSMSVGQFSSDTQLRGHEGLQMGKSSLVQPKTRFRTRSRTKGQMVQSWKDYASPKGS